MRNYYIFKVTGLLILFALSFFTVSAQEAGRITGKVTDKKTGEALIGLTVKLEGSGKGVSTDIDGRYSIGGLAPGRYILVFSYIGYQSKRVSDIVISAGKPVSLNVVMDEAASQQLEQVVINVSARQETIGALYAQQKNSARVSDGISADMITRSPDRNTGEVLKRVSGTTIQDNKFVIVRGLSDRYNNASLDNASLPSTEPNRKAFSFDIVPANLIDNIVINKTATPDMPADFAGGSVQIITKDIPDKNFTTISVGTGWNSQSTFKDFYSNRLKTANYFGFDNNRDLPGNFPANSRILGELSPQQRQDMLLRLPSVGNIKADKGSLAQSHQFTLGRVKDFDGGGRFGLLASLTYRNSENTRPTVERDYLYYDYSDRVNTFSTNVGALLNFSYSKGNNKFAFKNVYNRILDNRFVYREGLDLGKTSEIRYYASDLIQKGLFKTTIEGEHRPDEVHKLNWNASYSLVTNNQPDQLKIGYQRDAGSTDNVPFLAPVTSLTRSNNRLFLDMDESIVNAGVNDQMSVSLFSRAAKVKVGLGGQYRQRDFENRLIGPVLGYDENIDYEAIMSRPFNTLYGEDLLRSGVYDLQEIAVGAFRYNAKQYTGFGYAMLDHSIGEKSRIVWGVRAEMFNLNLTSNTDEDVKKDYFDILPSVNYTYAITPKSNFRASYYRTLARPELLEWAPTTYYDYENLYLIKGNSLLERSLIDNADIRYEVFPGAGQILSVSAFYKKFKNAIEPFVDDRNSQIDLTYLNTQKANNYGFELEVRHPLAFSDEAAPFFQNTGFYLNAARIWSKVDNPDDPLLIHKNRPMVGQSAYTINAGLQHNALEDRLNLSVLYNRIGRRIFAIGAYLLEHIWEAPRDVVDFQASYWLKKDRAQLKLNVSDILNSRYLFYFDNTQDKKYSGSKTITDTEGRVIEDEIQARYKTGTNVSLSFSYTF